MLLKVDILQLLVQILLKEKLTISLKNFSNDEAKFKLEYPLFNRLLDLYPRVLVTPHVGSYTDEAASNMIETSLENLKEYLDTGACKNDIKHSKNS